MQPQREETFHWSEIPARFADLDQRFEFELDGERRVFVARGVEVAPPRVVPWPFEAAGAEETARERAARLRRAREQKIGAGPLARYAHALPSFLPRQCVVLLQAGAASVAYFDKGEPLSTKSWKRYVVRGSGRAQPTYLSKKGRSRYGSRLRLQNAQSLHDDVNERLTGLWEEFGAPSQLFVSAPQRLWAEQFEGRVRPPFGRSFPVERVGLDLPVPTTEVLLRAYRSLGYGRVSSTEPGSVLLTPNRR